MWAIWQLRDRKEAPCCFLKSHWKCTLTLNPYFSLGSNSFLLSHPPISLPRTRGIDSIQGDFPGPNETSYLLQVTLSNVVLEENVIGETHSLEVSCISPVPRKWAWMVVFHGHRGQRKPNRQTRWGKWADLESRRAISQRWGAKLQ